MFDWSDEGPHQPTSHDAWSETAALVWYDSTAGIGGFHHIGQFVNRASGNYWHGLVTDDRLVYRAWSEDGPLRVEDRAPHYLAVNEGRMAFSFGKENSRLGFADELADVQLEFKDFYPICRSRGDDGGQVEHDVSPNHYESSGRAVGSARIDEQVYAIDNALYHRDHSWGPRNYAGIFGHRWIVGTAGADLSFCAVTLIGAANFVVGGYVVRNGIRHAARSTDVVVGLESDGVTIRSSEVRMTFDDTSDLKLVCSPIGGFLWGQTPFVCTDQIAKFESDDGSIGICCVEVSMRQRRDDPGIMGAATGVAVRDGLGHLSGPPVRSFSW